MLSSASTVTGKSSTKKERAMKRTTFASATIIGLLLFPFSSLGVAEESPPETIHFDGSTSKTMEAPGVYPRLYSGNVEFHHEKHFSSYGATCVDCHHMDGEELSAEPASDADALSCAECHDQEGLVYGRPADEMPEDELIMYRANTLHKLCVGCHERSSAEARALVAPLACRGCHAQRSRDYVLR